MALPSKPLFTKPAAQAPDDAPEQTAARVEEPEPTREERVAALLKSYEHAMNSNSPRTTAELAEIKALIEG